MLIVENTKIFFNMAEHDDMHAIYITRKHEDAIIPEQGVYVGYDLRCCKDYTLLSRKVTVVDIGVAILLPEGTYGRIVDRASMAHLKLFVVGGMYNVFLKQIYFLKEFIISGGVDRESSESCMALIFNDNDVDIVIKKHQLVAKLIVESVLHPHIVVTPEVEYIVS